MSVRVFLLKDIEKIGLAGEIIKVAEGYAFNYLIPRKLGIAVTPENEKMFSKRLKVVEKRKEALESQSSMLAEKVKSTDIIVKRKMHDDGKLYGSLNQTEIVDELAKKGINISKSQVEFGKSIKSKGNYEVTIKLSSKLKPKLKVKVISE